MCEIILCLIICHKDQKLHRKRVFPKVIAYSLAAGRGILGRRVLWSSDQFRSMAHTCLTRSLHLCKYEQGLGRGFVISILRINHNHVFGSLHRHLIFLYILMQARHQQTPQLQKFQRIDPYSLISQHSSYETYSDHAGADLTCGPALPAALAALSALSSFHQASLNAAYAPSYS